MGARGILFAVVGSTEDIAPGMLEKAKGRARVDGFNNIEFILEDIIANLRSHGTIAIPDFKRMSGFPGGCR